MQYWKCLTFISCASLDSIQVARFIENTRDPFNNTQFSNSAINLWRLSVFY